jgi:squalene synthase HpnC
VVHDETRISEEFLWAKEAEATRADAMLTRSTGENFPVAVRLLPADQRRHLMAVYGFARITDDIGDEAPPGDRLRLLDELEADLDRVNDGRPRLPVIRALVPTVRETGAPLALFRDLIAANRQDQVVARYETFDELLGYCVLSANCIGRIVLHVFGVYSQPRAELSDLVCTALQLAEHWQDVAEDYRAGRIYLPAEDLRRYDVTESDLAGRAAPARLRKLLAYETQRAGLMLDEGAALVGTLRGWPRLAVAGYVAGGRAALASIAAARYDVLTATPQPSNPRTAAGLLHAVVSGR